MFIVSPSLQCASLGIQLALPLPSKTSPGSRAAHLRWSPSGHRLGFLLSCKCMWRGNKGFCLLIDSDAGWSGIAAVCDDTQLSWFHLPIHHILAVTLLGTLSLWSWSCRSSHHACHKSLGSSLPGTCLLGPCAPQSPWFVPSWVLDTTPAGAELPFAQLPLAWGTAEIRARRQRHQKTFACDHSIALLNNQPPEVKALYRRKSNN